MKSKASVSRQIGKCLYPYGFFVVGSLLFAVVSVWLTLYTPILIGKAVDCVVGVQSVNFQALGQYLFWVGLMTLGVGVTQWLLSLCNNQVAYRVVRDLRRRIFEKLESLPVAYVDAHAQGDIVSRMITDVEQFSDGLLLGFNQLFTGVITILGTLLFMVSIHKGITLVVVLLTPVSLLVAAVIAKRSYLMFQKQSECRGEFTGLVDEMLGNQKVVQAFGYEKKAAERFDSLNERLQKVSRRAIFCSSITNPATRFVNGLVYAGVGITGACGVLQGALTVGQLSSFLSYANQYTKPFNEISGVITEMQNALACGKRIFDFLGEASEENTRGEETTSLRPTENWPEKGSVEFADVSFSYQKDQPLLQHLHLHIEAGEKIAIVGPTGCGKTTLIHLLLRFYDVDEGAIFLGGRDIRDMPREELRKHFGMVLQDTWLKGATVAENIGYGCENASMEEIVQAAKGAYAHDFIQRLPEGYQTVLDPDGESLSEGERQLLCIARVLLCQPEILILDEATSSIDMRTDLLVQKALRKMLRGRTSLIVAHRLATVREADCIVVMKDGKIIEQGNHETLLAQGGFYKELYQA